MTLLELQQECGRLLNDPSNQRWTSDVLTSRLNQAQTIVQGLTNAVKTVEVLTATVNTPQLTIDVDALDVLRVRLTLSNGSYKKLDGITREELDFRYPNWENFGAGEPLTYWFDGTNHQINLVPAPDSNNVVTNGVSVWEVLKPADMVNPTDIPFDSNSPMIPYHLACVHWAVAQCWMDDGTPEALGKAKFHKSGIYDRPGEFEKQIMRIREDFDVPVDVPVRILWRPQGGRVRSWSMPSKSYPFR